MPPEAARRARPRVKRRAAGRETIDVRTSDGWSLRADLHEPGQEAIGVAVLAHAMMARRTSFERPEGRGIAARLLERGWRVVVFDFRGHGDSGPRAAEGGSWSYDDLVRFDLPAVHEFARSQVRRRQALVVVGHSLGAHVALAAQGTGLVAFDGVVSVAGNLWLRDIEPWRARWLVKRASFAAAAALCRRLGRFPSRALRIGSDDEAGPFLEDLERVARAGRWTSADGSVDYLASLGSVRVPVMQIVSDGDRLECVPECGARFVARCAGPTEIVRVARADDGGPAPDHMGLVTSGRVTSAWERAEAWMRRLPVAS